ncbi:MAG: MFS transporter [Chloroflexota bacterium]
MNDANPRTKPLFYGWYIVAASIILQFASIGIGQVSVSIFMTPVTTAMGWPVWQYTLGSSLATGAGAISGIYAGQIIDQKGPRWLIVIGSVITALCFVGLGYQSDLWVFTGLYIISGFVGWNLFGPMVVNATINKWFIKKRGWALAIGSIGISLGGLVTPITMTTVVDSVGWRNGYIVLAIFAIAVIIPLAFVMRRTPEDEGLLPDGEIAHPDHQASTQAQTKQPAFTRAEALRTRSFWLIVAGFGLNQTALTSVLVHAIPFATANGFSRNIAALGVTINGLGNLSAKPVWGYLLQRIEARKLVVAAFSISAIGVSLMITAAATGIIPLLFLGFYFYGFGFGGTIPLGESVWAIYFGRAHIGAIRGISQPLTIIGPMTGPILVGAWFDYTQTYQLAFLAIIGVYLTGALLIGLSRRPEKLI